MMAPPPTPSPAEPATERIVVTLDGSRRSADAVPVGVALAERSRVAVAFVTVVTKPDDTDATVAACAEFVPRERIETVVADDAATGILDATDAAPAVTLRCMASHGRGAVRGQLLGSVAEEVVRRATTPTVLVGPGFDPLAFVGVERLVVCTDGSATGERVVPTALRWARALDVAIEFLTVRPTTAWEPADSVRPAAEDRGHDPIARLDDADADHVRRMAEAATAEGLHAGWEVLGDDDPAAAIVEYVRHRPGTLLALHTHGRDGAGGRHRFGRVTLKVVRGARAPVLLTGPGVVDEG